MSENMAVVAPMPSASESTGDEAGIAAQSAQAVADITAEFVEETQAYGGAISFVLRRGLA
jgi:hypothetical protein